MKKIFFILGGLLAVLVITIVILNATNNVRAEVEEGFKSDEDFLLVLGASTCGYCVEYKREVLSVYKDSETGLELKFMYSDRHFPSTTAFEDFLGEFNIQYQASPTTYIVKDGQVIASEEGYMPLEELYDFIETNY